MKLTPLIAIAYMSGITSKYVISEYNKMIEDIKNDKFERMDLLHHYLSGFKSLFTQQSYDGLIQVR